MTARFCEDRIEILGSLDFRIRLHDARLYIWVLARLACGRSLRSKPSSTAHQCHTVIFPNPSVPRQPHDLRDWSIAPFYPTNILHSMYGSVAKAVPSVPLNDRKPKRLSRSSNHASTSRPVYTTQRRIVMLMGIKRRQCRKSYRKDIVSSSVSSNGKSGRIV